ncbi:hypothetical protein ACGFR8_07605 [Streptomyces brevispora]|uniref:hypothetical protein n=1 Tax=Streptomyces brevispora TaxID=887462 RepID=UPI00371DB3F7
MLRVTMHATTDRPLSGDVEAALRAVAAGEDVSRYAEQITPLGLRRYVGFEDSRPLITELGARYLVARDERRYPTPIQVETVDIATRTARVIVVGWSITDGVTVLLDQLTSATSLEAEQLPGRFLEAVANCQALEADDLVLTDVTIAPPIPAEWLDGQPAAATSGTGRVDGAPSGGEV